MKGLSLMADPTRPLSPHLSVYRWQISNTLSILHRATGVFMAFGGVVLSLWLVAAAAGPDSYLRIVDWLGTPIGMILLVGWSFSFFYHLANGIRHLFWDAGMGFALDRARTSGIAVVVAATIMTVMFWVIALSGGGA